MSSQQTHTPTTVTAPVWHERKFHHIIQLQGGDVCCPAKPKCVWLNWLFSNQITVGHFLRTFAPICQIVRFHAAHGAVQRYFSSVEGLVRCEWTRRNLNENLHPTLTWLEKKELVGFEGLKWEPIRHEGMLRTRPINIYLYIYILYSW